MARFRELAGTTLGTASATVDLGVAVEVKAA
jgi:hypothetical protein